LRDELYAYLRNATDNILKQQRTLSDGQENGAWQKGDDENSREKYCRYKERVLYLHPELISSEQCYITFSRQEFLT
jgi:hypothetical protein